MDINYLLRREQISIARAQSSGSRSARAVHRAFALAYGKLLIESSCPHNRSQTDDERAVPRDGRERDARAAGEEESEGAGTADRQPAICP